MQTLTNMDKVNHWGLSPYDNNRWERELNETNASIVKLILKTLGPPFLNIYI